MQALSLQISLKLQIVFLRVSGSSPIGPLRPPLAVREPLPLMVSVQPAGTLIAAFILPPLIVFVPSRVRFSVALFSSLIQTRVDITAIRQLDA